MQREGRGGERRLHERLAFVVRVDNRASVAHVAVTPAAFGLCIVVFAVLVAATYASGCVSLSSQYLLPLPMPCFRACRTPGPPCDNSWQPESVR